MGYVGGKNTMITFMLILIKKWEKQNQNETQHKIL